MKYLFSVLALFLGIPAFSQVHINRSHAPAAGPAPVINIGTPASFITDNGIKVFVVENHKVPKVNVSLILKRDPILQGDKVGYVSMAGTMMRRGTETKSKAELDQEIAFLGGSVSSGSTSASASSLTKNFDKIFSIFSDVVLHPAFRDSELAKVKKRALSGLEAEKDDPSSILNNVVSVVNYGKDYPYGEVETDTTVKNIEVSDLKNYYNTYWKPNIAFMAFVGDINTEKAKELVEKYLGQWQRGDIPKHNYTEPQKPARNMVYVADRPSAVQTNIDITDPITFKPGSADYFAANIMNRILGGGSSGWLFQDLREKYGFTYGAYSRIGTDPLVGSFSASAAVRTEVTDSSLMRFMVQLNRIRNEQVGAAKLDSAKNVMSGNFALSLESPSRIAQFALNIARYNMPKDFYKNYLKSIDSVTAADVQQVARKYVTPDRANIVLVGNSKDFSKELSKYGQVQYVDIYGNPVDAPVNKAVSEDVTPKSVIDKYIEAIGGRDKIKEVKDLSVQASTEMQGQKIEITQKYLLPDKFVMTVTLPAQNMTVSKMLVNRDKVESQRMGQEVPLNAEQKEGLKKQTNPFQEMDLLNGAYKLKLTGIENIDGKEAYALKATDSSGKVTNYYFDTDSGLELRQATSNKTPQGEVSSITDFSDYQEVEGIKFPFAMKTQNGPMKMDMTVDSVKVNSGLKESDFQ